eukprot:CAMPEP_0197439472 /NCGR_PEP_ID=MMETSP1175-20131217/6208_1 /TAXON_ID=1003142 /ORGANISM="Triceratium dubium, Strain CCMP147" /LENGTH=483 /DNA_ID=CAMNT_0042969393 /DNA_START=25 /DNA_END=1476 /DNA_ORIENTATION=-
MNEKESAPFTPSLSQSKLPPIFVERALESVRLASSNAYPKAGSGDGGDDGGDVNSQGDWSLSTESDDASANGGGIPAGIVPQSHAVHYTESENLRMLEKGGCLFSFSCSHNPTQHEAEMINSVVNLSAFEDETRFNYVPHFDVGTFEEGTLTFLLARCAYLIHGVRDLDDIADVSLLSSTKYQRACQPSGTKIWTDYDKMDQDNFRITKPIIPYIYSFTVQFRVSALSGTDLAALGRHVGIRVDRGILLERTKRSVPPKEDATKKCKSVLLYTNLGRGVVLVTHLTVLLQRGLPSVIERVIHTFGSWGLGETCETAWKTRDYLRNEVLSESKMKWDEMSFRTAVSQAYQDALSSFGADSTVQQRFSFHEASEEVSSRLSEDAFLDAFSSFRTSCSVSSSFAGEESVKGRSYERQENDRNAKNSRDSSIGSTVYSDGDCFDDHKDGCCHSCQCCLGCKAAQYCRPSNLQRAPLIAGDQADLIRT